MHADLIQKGGGRVIEAEHLTPRDTGLLVLGTGGRRMPTFKRFCATRILGIALVACRSQRVLCALLVTTLIAGYSAISAAIEQQPPKAPHLEGPQAKPAAPGCKPGVSHEDEEEFDSVVTRHAEEVKELFGMRGLPPPQQEFFLAHMDPLHLDSPVHRDFHKTLPAELRRNFPENSAVLFYYFYATRSNRGDEGVLSVWLVAGCGVAAYGEVETRIEDLNALMVNLRRGLGVHLTGLARAPMKEGEQEEPAVYPSGLPLDPTIIALSKMLFPRRIAGSLSSVKHLIIVPFLGLGTVPFAVLRPFAQGEFLIDRMSISVAPSLFDLWSPVSTWNPRFETALIVGNPQFTNSGGWVYPQLPGAEQEARQIAQRFGASPLIGESANKENVVAQALRADFLFFGTHGVASRDEPLRESFLALSVDPKGGSRWTAEEIQRSPLHARLAVLSACQTGLGKVHDAGIIGLARAFQIAGVPRVVMSLWSVRDDATSELMVFFSEQLQSHAPAEALRQAMLQVRKRRPDPSEWAPFVLFGSPR
jgi:hypothetical protein